MSLPDIATPLSILSKQRAYVAPGVLFLLPVAAYCASSGLFTSVEQVSVLVVALYVAANLFAFFPRTLGEEIEKDLFPWDSVRAASSMLRHRDGRLDVETKRRYHLFLAAKLNRAFPTSAEEAWHPQEADELYIAAAKWLEVRAKVEKGVGHIHASKDWYLFMRSCFAVKRAAIGFAILIAAWVLVCNKILTWHGLVLHAFVTMTPATQFGFYACIVLAAVWLFFTEERVKHADFTCGGELLSLCDILESKKNDAEPKK